LFNLFYSIVYLLICLIYFIQTIYLFAYLCLTIENYLFNLICSLYLFNY